MPNRDCARGCYATEKDNLQHHFAADFEKLSQDNAGSHATFTISNLKLQLLCSRAVSENCLCSQPNISKASFLLFDNFRSTRVSRWSWH